MSDKTPNRKEKCLAAVRPAVASPRPSLPSSSFTERPLNKTPSTSTEKPPSRPPFSADPPRGLHVKVPASLAEQKVKLPSTTDQKTLKRKLFPQPDEDEKQRVPVPPKKKKSAAVFSSTSGLGSPSSSPSPPSVSSSTTPQAKCPPSSTAWPVTPLSERQQLALLMKMTADQKQQSATGDSSPRPCTPTSTPVTSAKKTPLDKKVHKRNERGETALHISAIKGDAKQTKRLIKAGADVNVKDFAGWTPLHEACNHGWLSVAKQLLKAGANVNCQGLDNDTPLHDATINGHRKLVIQLLRHGANPLQANTKGLTPFDVAANPEITALLRKEVITSSSESSSLDETRSPTSPESVSEHDNDHPESLTSPGALGQQELSADSRRSSTTSEKLSPRLTLKFHKNKEEKSKEFFKSYSVKVEEEKSELFGGDEEGFALSSVVNRSYLDKMDKKDRMEKDPYAFEDISDEEGPMKSKPSERLEFKVADFGRNSVSEFWRDRPDSSNPGPSSEWPPGVEPLSEKSDTKLNRVENWIDCSQFKDSEVSQSSVTSSHDRNPDSTDRPRSRSRSPITGMSSSVKEKGSRVGTPVADSSTGLLLHKEDSNDRRERDVNRASPRSEPPHRFSPKLSPKSDSRMSPKSDKERSSSPKVPPLKIIIPSKHSPTDEAKKLANKLPYVLNPTQEERANAELMLMEAEQVDQVASTSAEAEPLIPLPDEKKTTGEADSVKSANSEKSDSKRAETREARETRESARIKELKEKTKDTNSDSNSSTAKEPTTTVPSTSSTPTPPSSTTKPVSTVAKNGSSSSSSSAVAKVTEVAMVAAEGEVSTSGGIAVTAAGGASGRCLRSQTKQLQQAEKKGGKDSDSSSSHEKDRDSKKSDPDTSNSAIPPRKRKMRQKEEKKEEEKTSTVPIPPPTVFEKPENPYEVFLDIRKQIISRRQTMFAVQPKAPDGYKDYLLVSNNYVLAGNPQSRIAVPMLPPPNSVQAQGGAMKDCFLSQEKERYKLRLQHKMEREKLMLAMEQEIIRVHGRAARAMANQALPFSVCSVLREEDIYNSFDSEQVRKAALKDVVNMEKDKNVRSRYNGRQFLSWLQDVIDKYEKLKESLLLRHHHEAESMNAVQKMEWEWKLRELGLLDGVKTTPKIDEVHVPMVHVKDEFDLLPT